MAYDKNESEEAKEFDRGTFDSLYNENIKGERINNKPYPDAIKSADEKASVEKTNKLINSIPNRYAEHR